MDLPELHLRAGLLAAGFADAEVRRLVRAGELTPVRPGAYVREPPEDAVARHALAVQAAITKLADGAVVSHISAAVLYGLPIWGVALDRVHVTRARRTGGRRDGLVHMHTAALEPDDVRWVGGLPTTSLARTTVDLARTLPFEQAVVLADAALSAARINWDELADRVERAKRWPGAPAARRVLAFADGLSASVGESRSRVAIAAAGLPRPTLQWNVHSDRGFVGRVDFGWPSRRTVGEFDGLVKYRQAPGRDSVDALVAEKRREDALRAEGLAVVRWTWADLKNFHPIAARLRAAFS